MDSCGKRSPWGCRWKPEGSCLWLFLGFCVLMVQGGSLLSQEFEQKWWSYLCPQVCQHLLSSRGIWVWSTVAQDQLLAL